MKSGSAEATRAAPVVAQVLVVDDHPLVRSGLVDAIDQCPDLRVTAEAASAAEAMERVWARRPDVVVTDLSLPDVEGFDLIRRIREADPKLPILVYTMHDEALRAAEAIRAGALGYLTKDSDAATLLAAVRQVLAGQVCLSPRLASRTIRSGVAGADPAGMASLTPREREVFGLMGEGLGMRQIAEHLGSSVKTIETHREHLREKLGLANANAVLHCAVRRHLRNAP